MKFILVQLGRIGDMILLTPIFNKIKQLFPDASIDLLAGRHNSGIVSNNPNINHIFTYEKTPLKFISLLKKIRANRYDYLIDPKDHYSRESYIFANIIKAKNKIGFNPSGKNTFNIKIESQEENAGKHYVERSLQALYPLGYKKEHILPKPELFLFQESEKYFNQFLKANNISKYIVLNVSASRENKMWKSHKWIEFLEEAELSNFDLVITNSPTEQKLAEEIKKSCPFVNLFPSRSINDIISAISKSALVISPDTAIVHIAAAFDKALFALYNGLESFFHKFYPLSSKKEIVKSPLNEGSIESIATELAVSKFNEFIKEFI